MRIPCTVIIFPAVEKAHHDGIARDAIRKHFFYRFRNPDTDAHFGTIELFI